MNILDEEFIPLATPEEYDYDKGNECNSVAVFSHVLKQHYIGPVCDQLYMKSLLRFTGSEHKY